MNATTLKRRLALQKRKLKALALAGESPSPVREWSKESLRELDEALSGGPNQINYTKTGTWVIRSTSDSTDVKSQKTASIAPTIKAKSA